METEMKPAKKFPASCVQRAKPRMRMADFRGERRRGLTSLEQVVARRQKGGHDALIHLGGRLHVRRTLDLRRDTGCQQFANLRSIPGVNEAQMLEGHVD